MRSTIAVIAVLFLAWPGASSAAQKLDFDRGAPSLRETLQELREAASAAAKPKAVVVSETGRAKTSEPERAASFLLGIYHLDHPVVEWCPPVLEVVAEKFGNSGVGDRQESYGFYGHPRGTGLLISQILDVNAGVQKDRDENPMSFKPWPDVSYRLREAAVSGDTLTFRQGHLSRWSPDLDSGTLFEASLRGRTLTVRSGLFFKRNGPIGELRLHCVYTKAAE
ncbi:MAG: hypothetical protein WC943_03105 [Elusimicrobiota bacterium]|jgi:hypothetical protein